MSAKTPSATVTSHELSEAILNDGLILCYQPIVAADTARLIGVEALVRMKRGCGETVMPDSFIPLAEDSGLIIALGEWVLRRACTDGLRWPGLRVAVNMSPMQLQNDEFVGVVQRILRETAFPPALLELELTERSILQDVKMAKRGIEALRRLGVSIALDDFGTGYSGLIYLRRLPLDKIKIDRAFTDALGQSEEADVVMRSMIRLACDLGKTVTAEGVEELAHQAILTDAGCHELQGYLFSRPLLPQDIDAMYAISVQSAEKAAAEKACNEPVAGAA